MMLEKQRADSQSHMHTYSCTKGKCTRNIFKHIKMCKCVGFGCILNTTNSRQGLTYLLKLPKS